MLIGVLRAELQLPGMRSLKDKRRIIKSLLDRVVREFRVAAAEVAFHDSRERAALGVACVSTEGRHANQILSHVVALIERETDAELTDYSIEIL